MAEPPVLTGAVQARSIRDGPLAVAASPVGAPGAVREMSLTLTSVPAVQERPVEGQTLPAPALDGNAAGKSERGGAQHEGEGVGVGEDAGGSDL